MFCAQFSLEGVERINFYLGIASLARTRSSTGRIILKRFRSPIPIPHITIPGTGISANLHPTGLTVTHFLHALPAPEVRGGTPNGLSQVCILGIGPLGLVLDPTTHDVIDGIQLTPFAAALVLGEVLPVLGIIVLDTGGRARVEKLTCVGVGGRFEGGGPT